VLVDDGVSEDGEREEEFVVAARMAHEVHERPSHRRCHLSHALHEVSISRRT